MNQHPRHQACLGALPNQLHNLEETIGQLVALMKNLAEGEILEDCALVNIGSRTIARAI
jgi:hypothetical protein